MKLFIYNVLGILFFLTTTSMAQLPEKRIIVGTVYNIFHEEYQTDQDFF